MPIVVKDRYMTTAETPSSPARILAIDDEEDLRHYYRQVLSKAGYEAQTAASAKAALHLLQEQTFDLILLDLRMPGMDGMEFLRKLRRQRHAPDVLLLSGYATVEDAAEATKLGVSEVLLKPCSGEKLLARINHLLDLRRDPLVSYIRTHFDKLDSREEVARRFRVSPGTVSNRIRHYTGQSFLDFLHSCRIREAQRLLAETELEAKEIAARVGFHSPQVFDRAFQQHAGRSPSQYRREVRSAQG